MPPVQNTNNGLPEPDELKDDLTLDDLAGEPKPAAQPAAAADAPKPGEGAKPEEQPDPETELLLKLAEVNPERFSKIMAQMEAEAAPEPEKPKEEPKPEAVKPDALDLTEEQAEEANFTQVMDVVQDNFESAQSSYAHAYNEWRQSAAVLQEMESNGETETKAYQILSRNAENMRQQAIQVYQQQEQARADLAMAKRIDREVAAAPILKGAKTFYAQLRATGQIPNGTPVRTAIETLNRALVASGRKPVGVKAAATMQTVSGDARKAAAERLNKLKMKLGSKGSGGAAAKPAGKDGGSKLDPRAQSVIDSI